MGKDKKKSNKKQKKKVFHYDYNSFFLDDVLKEIKEHREEKKKNKFTY